MRPLHAAHDRVDAARSSGATRRTCVETLNRLRSTMAPAIAAVSARSRRSARSSSGTKSSASSRRRPLPGNPTMSSPWLPT